MILVGPRCHTPSPSSCSSMLDCLDRVAPHRRCHSPEGARVLMARLVLVGFCLVGVLENVDSGSCFCVPPFGLAGNALGCLASHVQIPKVPCYYEPAKNARRGSCASGSRSSEPVP